MDFDSLDTRRSREPLPTMASGDVVNLSLADFPSGAQGPGTPRRRDSWARLKASSTRAAGYAIVLYLGQALVSISGVITRTVRGESMAPTIHAGDRLETPLGSGQPRRGDIIIFFQSPFATLKNVLSIPDCTPFVKRLVGLPGDTVTLRDGVLAVNGQELSLFGCRVWGAAAEWHVPPEHYFVLGDNSAASIDSRNAEVGFVPAGAIRVVRSCTRPDGTPVLLENPWKDTPIPEPRGSTAR